MKKKIAPTMTPLYTGNEYYKKMLDLQERLRKSEEERIRLEERFSLLEHESRSRHETCINRLRMRYIEFLEEQQSRDERNHQLLGALDRVDSSLALMSAKTDRLGILRKQYEASILASYENRRPNGSVTGDSGVASQNEERQRRRDERGTRNDAVGHSNRGMMVGPVQASGKNRARNSSSQEVRSFPSYSNKWSGVNGENLQKPSLAFSRFSQGPSLSNVRDSPLGNYENSRSILSPKNSLDRPKSSLQSLKNFKISPTFRSDSDTPRFGRSENPRSQKIEFGDPGPSLKYERSIVKNLANSGAYESGNYSKFFNDSPGEQSSALEHSRFGTNRNIPEIPSGNLNFAPNSVWGERKYPLSSSSSRSPKLSEILRQELGDEEEQIGSTVENQLERYISKIRSLHREAEPHSLDEMNTSGDLLNVTLSDDDVDFPLEEKPRARGSLPQELGNVMALAEDLASKTCDMDVAEESNERKMEIPSERSLFNDGGFVVDDSQPRVKNNVESEEVERATSINRRPRRDLLEERKNSSGSEKLGSLAKNGINVDAPRAKSKLGSRPAINIENIAKFDGDSAEVDDDDDVEKSRFNEVDPGESSIVDRVHETPRESEERRRSIDRLDDSRYRVLSGVEREADDNLCDIVEDLEPWNISALERRVQEIILNDEAQDDYIGRGGAKRSSQDDGSSRKTAENVEDLSGTYDEWNESGRSEIVENDQRLTKTNDRFENDEKSNHEEEKSFSQSNETSSPLKEAENIGVTDLSGNDDVASRMENAERKSDDDYANQVAYAREEYPETGNSQYGYNADGEYQDPNEQYRYNANGSGMYEGHQYSNQYEEDPQKYVGDPDQAEYVQKSDETGFTQNPSEFVQDPNHEYVQDPNQAEYVQDPNQGEYVQDPNQAEYIQDPNQGEYVQDPNQTEYVQDPNQTEYVQDPNQAEYVQDPNQTEYVQDPNQAAYVQDTNQADYVQDPNPAEYVQDPNQAAYVQDPNQAAYVQDPNQAEYVEDPNQAAYVQDPNQAEYIQDPNQVGYTQDPNQMEYVQDPNQAEYVQDPSQAEYIQDPNQAEYVQDPNQAEYVQDPNQANYVEDPNQHYATDPNLEYPANSNQQYAMDQEYSQDQQYSVDPNQDYSTNPQQYAADPSGQYTGNSNIDYSNDPNRYIEESDHNQQYASESDPNQHFVGSESNQQPNAIKLPEDYETGDSDRSASVKEMKISPTDQTKTKTSKDVIKGILDSDTESTIEKNVSNTESDFDFN